MADGQLLNKLRGKPGGMGGGMGGGGMGGGGMGGY